MYDIFAYFCQFFKCNHWFLYENFDYGTGANIDWKSNQCGDSGLDTACATWRKIDIMLKRDFDHIHDIDII